VRFFIHMSTDNSTEKTYSWAELDAACEKALISIRKIAEEVCGTDPIENQKLRHKKKSYPATVQTYTDLFKILNESNNHFTAAEFISFLDKRVSPQKLNAMQPDVAEVTEAAVKELLVALDIKPQFVEYSRSSTMSSRVVQ
jgi:hypothetical protein